MKLKKMMNGFLLDFLTKNNIEFEDWSINVNNQDGFGDYSSNIALKLAKKLKKLQLKLQTILLSIKMITAIFLQ